MWLLLFFVLFLLLLLMIPVLYCPYTSERVAAGSTFKVGDQEHRIADHTRFPKGQPRLLQKTVLDQELSIFHFAKALLESLDMTFWAICGTWLAAERHGGFSAWDDDTDLAILHKDVPKLFAALPRIRDHGYDLLTRGGAIKLIPRTFLPFPFIDFVVMQEDQGQMKLCYPLDANGQCTFEKSKEWRKEVYSMDRVFPLRFIPFEDTTIPVPNDKTLLDETYPNWQTEAYNKPFERINNHATYALLWRLGLNPWF